MLYSTSAHDIAAACSRAISAAIDWWISPSFRRRTPLVRAMVRAARRNVAVTKTPTQGNLSQKNGAAL